MVFFMETNKFSKIITQDDSLPAAQAMLYGIGLNEKDLKKAQVGIASTGFEGNPCNMHLNILAHQIKKSILKSEFYSKLVDVSGIVRNNFIVKCFESLLEKY